MFFSKISSQFDNETQEFRAILNGISFLKQHQNHLNVDALFGVQIVRTQAWILNQQFNIPEHSFYLNKINFEAEDLIKKSLEKVILNDVKYFKQIGNLLDEYLWSRIDCEKRFVNETLSYRNRFAKDNLTEAISDYCLGELFSSNICKQSKFCEDKMLKKIYKNEYGVAHQLLYLFVSFQVSLF